MIGYCMKCRAKREMQNPKQVRTRNGRKGYKGTCPVCGSKMFKIGG